MNNNRKAPDSYFAYKENPTRETRAALMSDMKDTIQSSLHVYGNPSMQMRAHILAEKSLGTYDPKSPYSLKSHVYNAVQKINREAIKRSQVVKLPENVYYDRKHVATFKKEFLDKHRYTPSNTEIADGMKISKKRVAKANTKEKGILTNEKGDSSIVVAKSTEDIAMDYVYHDLSDTNKKILGMTTGHDGHEKVPRKMIARKLGISPSALTQRTNTIAKKIEETMRDV